MQVFETPISRVIRDLNNSPSLLLLVTSSSSRHLFQLHQNVVLSVIDYGLGLTTMAQTNLLKLDRVQSEARRVILGTTKDTPTETTRFMLDLLPMQTRQKVEQVKAYFSAVENPHNPLHEAVKDIKGCRLERSKSWMGQAEDSIPQVW